MIIAKYTIFKKTMTIRDPSFITRGIKSDMFTPIICPANIATKEKSVYYNLKLKNNATGEDLDIAIELPPSENNNVHHSCEHDQFVWITENSDSDFFKLQVNELLSYWKAIIKQASKYDPSIPEAEILNLYPSTTLFWPWKEDPEKYFNTTYNPATKRHVIKIGSGYYQKKEKLNTETGEIKIYPVVGVTLNLSSFPSIWTQPAEETKSTRKRTRPNENNSSSTADDNVVSIIEDHILLEDLPSMSEEKTETM